MVSKDRRNESIRVRMEKRGAWTTCMIIDSKTEQRETDNDRGEGTRSDTKTSNIYHCHFVAESLVRLETEKRSMKLRHTETRLIRRFIASDNGENVNYLLF